VKTEELLCNKKNFANLIQKLADMFKLKLLPVKIVFQQKQRATKNREPPGLEPGRVSAIPGGAAHSPLH